MRRQFTVIASILAGCLIIGFLFSRVTVSQVAPVAPQPMGRYQVSITSTTNGPGANATHFVVLCDTANGQCWIRGTGYAQWNDLGIPASAKVEQMTPRR
jgi:hypothetical protein